MTIVNKIENLWIVYILRSFWGFQYLNPISVSLISCIWWTGKGKISVVLNKSQLSLCDHRLVQLSILSGTPKFALKFFRKDSYLLIFRKIQTDQNLGFIIHDFQVHLSLVVI